MTPVLKQQPRKLFALKSFPWPIVLTSLGIIICLFLLLSSYYYFYHHHHYYMSFCCHLISIIRYFLDNEIYMGPDWHLNVPLFSYYINFTVDSAGTFEKIKLKKRNKIINKEILRIPSCCCLCPEAVRNY